MEKSSAGIKNCRPFRTQVQVLLVSMIVVVMLISGVCSNVIFYKEFERQQEGHMLQLRQAIVRDLQLQDKANLVLEKQMEERLNGHMTTFAQAYQRAENDPARLDLAQLQAEAGADFDFFIIDKDSVIRYHSRPNDVGIDFKKSDRMNAFFPIVWQSLKPVSDRANISTTRGLRKFIFGISPDKQYILGIGISLASETFLAQLSMDRWTQEFTDQRNDIRGITLYNYDGRTSSTNAGVRTALTGAAKQAMQQAVVTGKPQVHTEGNMTYEYFLIPREGTISQINSGIVAEIMIDSTAWQNVWLGQLSLQAAAFLMALLLFLAAGRMVSRRVAQPIQLLMEQVSRIAQGNLTAAVVLDSKDEFGLLAYEIDQMRDKLQATMDTLVTNNKQLKIQEEALQQAYQKVEEKVQIRTQELFAANEELTAMNQQHQAMNETLQQAVRDMEREIQQRQQAQQQLTQAMEHLKNMQEQLIQSEKMAALGGLVAGIAHEVNTPLGVSLTASTHLQAITAEFLERCTAADCEQEELTEYLENLQEAAVIIAQNSERAGKLIKSFKQVAIDQSYEAKRTFEIKSYLDEILVSLYPVIKKEKHKVTAECEAGLALTGFPGAFAQIVTNLLMNSVLHGYERGVSGKISIRIAQEAGSIVFSYHDDGKGMEEAVRLKMFNPFFTTRRGSGGTGLGLFIVYNIVTQHFKGTIECESAAGEGTAFRIYFPFEGEK